MIEHSNNISQPKKQARKSPSIEDFPLYIKSVGHGKLESDGPESRCIYKFINAEKWMVVSIINGSVDVKIREQRTPSFVFDEWLKGEFNYVQTDVKEFTDLMSDVQAHMADMELKPE